MEVFTESGADGGSVHVTSHIQSVYSCNTFKNVLYSKARGNDVRRRFENIKGH